MPTKPRHTVTIRDSIRFGPDQFAVMAGPCAVEDREQLSLSADAVRHSGGVILRGGAFKPRTSHDSFQGLGDRGLELLAEAERRTGLPVVTEVLDPRHVERVGEVASILQIGSRNMQNFPLLREVGRFGKPVLLKRGAAATLDELIAAAGYVMAEGNRDVILCERGIRGFDPGVRYTLDLTAVPRLRARTGLPVVVDPSHGTGARELVRPMALAALACGADGLLIEVHPDPGRALSDGRQALLPADFAALMTDVRRFLTATERKLASADLSDHLETAGASWGTE